MIAYQKAPRSQIFDLICGLPKKNSRFLKESHQGVTVPLTFTQGLTKLSREAYEAPAVINFVPTLQMWTLRARVPYPSYRVSKHLTQKFDSRGFCRIF